MQGGQQSPSVYQDSRSIVIGNLQHFVRNGLNFILVINIFNLKPLTGDKFKINRVHPLLHLREAISNYVLKKDFEK